MPATPQKSHLRLRFLAGLQDYVDTWERMKQFTAERDTNTQDEIWLLQHPPVFTQGQAGKAEHVLNPHNIPVVPVDRGGQVTYHGPGQLVVYLLLDVARLKIGTRALVTAIETAIINSLKQLGIAANADPEAPGVYVNGAKIASLGIRVRKPGSYHGLALNVAMDLEPFSYINPCGYAGLIVTQVADLIDDTASSSAHSNPTLLEQVSELLCAELIRILGYTDVTRL